MAHRPYVNWEDSLDAGVEMAVPFAGGLLLVVLFLFTCQRNFYFISARGFTEAEEGQHRSDMGAI